MPFARPRRRRRRFENRHPLLNNAPSPSHNNKTKLQSTVIQSGVVALAGLVLWATRAEEGDDEYAYSYI